MSDSVNTAGNVANSDSTGKPVVRPRPPKLQHSSAEPRLTGTVKNVRKDNGFAFIAGDDGHDRFMHRSEFHGPPGFDALCVGHRVSFYHEPNERGDRAAEVVILPADSSPRS